MIQSNIDIDGNIIVPKRKKKKIKDPLDDRKQYTTFFNYQLRQLDLELERKLPNEFKGSILRYNHRNTGGFGVLDDNLYNHY
jgi:hypothetical protein